MSCAAIPSCVLALTLLVIGSVPPAAAQTNAPLVMRCTFDGYTNQTLDYVVDLGGKTMTLTHTITGNGQPGVQHFSGRVTDVSDAEIVWVYTDPHRTVTDTLNRYSGQIVSHIVFPPDDFTVLESCQRQQKQF